MTRSLEHLERLVGFASLTDGPNREIVDYVEAILRSAGARVHRITQGGSEKSGIFAALGPQEPGGIMLSGHVDVVAVAGQAWRSDPFQLRRDGRRVYGRGTADMKGFLACMLTAAEAAATLVQPLKLAFSWDEEIGCRGIPLMLDHLDATVGKPVFCIVGEPTQMQIATGHKGKTALKALCFGEAGHSAEAPEYVNALHVAADFISMLREEQARIARSGARDESYGTPYTTLHAGILRGGSALNIVPDLAEVSFEIRHLAADDPEEIASRLTNLAEQFGKIEIEAIGGYPGLETGHASAAVSLLKDLLPDADLTKVSFGTEAGHFSRRGVETVVCGPGSMDQGHKPDEFIEIDQIEACDAFLNCLTKYLTRA